MDPASIMALISGASSLLGGLTGNKGEFKSTFNKNQTGFIDSVLNDLRSMRGNQDITQNQGYQQGQNWLNSLFNDQDFFKNFEAPLQRQFQEETIPGLANRFASMGSGGSLGSTAFRNQANREAGNLSTNIAALRGGMQQQGVNQGLQYAQQPFQNYMSLMNQALQPTRNVYQPPSTGFFGGLAAPFAQGAASLWGQQAGQNYGNPNAGVAPSTNNNWNQYASMAAGQFPGT